MKKLTPNDRNFLETYLKTGNLAEAARAGGSKGKDVHSLSTRGGQILKKLELSLAELLDQRGLNDAKLLNFLDAGLNATKVISCNVIAQNGEGMADAHSMTKDFVEVEDQQTRFKFLEMAFKLKGHMKDKPVDPLLPLDGKIELIINFV